MPSNPRITIIGLHFPPETTGNAPYTGSLARGLLAKDLSTLVITGHPHYPEWVIRTGYGAWVRRELVDGVHVTRLRHYVPSKPNAVRRLLSEVSFGIRVLFESWGRPDVVVLVSPALFATAIAVLRARLSPSRPAVVVWVQDLYSLGVTEIGAGGRSVAAIMTWVEAMTLRAASKVVVIHERFAIYARESLGVEAQRIQVVRNWTHLASAPDRDVAAVRSGFGWDADETVVLHAGNMGAKQGLENVIAAARLCDDANLPIRFVLLGDGNQREHLELIGSGVKRLQFIDPVADSDFQAVLASADILLINEKPGVSGMSVPSKLTSYFDSGRAVVAATGPDGITAAELQAADGGFVVESGDPGALVTVCLNLREHPEKAEAFGNNGRQFRRDVLGEERAIAGFANMLEDVATKKAR